MEFARESHSVVYLCIHFDYTPHSDPQLYRTAQADMCGAVF